MTAELDIDRPPPFVGQAIHRRLRELTGVKTPYLAAKRRFNSLAMEVPPKLAELARRDDDTMLAAALYRSVFFAPSEPAVGPLPYPPRPTNPKNAPHFLHPRPHTTAESPVDGGLVRSQSLAFLPAAG